MQDFFKDLKIVEFAGVLAGPAVGMFFAELGAEVVKIENKTTGGDITRGWKLPVEDRENPISAYFCSVNWGKKYLHLDLSDPGDAARARQICRDADVVISNFKPSSARRLGFDAEALRAENQRLIYAQLDAFADPEDESPAFDIVLQAEAGFLFMCGEKGRAPVRMPVALIDLLAAHQLKEAVLLALLRREKTGRGALVRTSLLESAIASLANQATNWLMAGQIPQRMGTAHPNIAPYGDIFTAADGKTVVLAVGTERQFRGLCEILKLKNLLETPDFQENTSRVRNRERLNALLAEVIERLPGEQLIQNLKSAGVPAAIIRDMREVFQIPAAQAMILEEKIEETETRRVKTIAFSIE